MAVDDLCKDCIEELDLDKGTIELSRIGNRIIEHSYKSALECEKRREEILNNIPECLRYDPAHNMMVYLKENDSEAYQFMVSKGFSKI